MIGKNSSQSPEKYFSPLDAWAMAFGVMVGWGAFVMPGNTFLPLAGPTGTIISMAIGLACMLLIGFCVSFLMKRSAQSRGIYAYTKEAFGRDHAFLCAWFLCLSYLTIVFLNGTALFLVIKTILGETAYTGYHYTIAGKVVYLNEFLLSLCALVGVGLLFLWTRTFLRRFSTILAVILLVGIVVTTIFCLPKALEHNLLCHSFGYEGVNKGWAIFNLVILAPWAFVGFEVITLDTVHFKFSLKKTTWVIVSSIVVAALVYTSLALVSVSAIPDGYSDWTAYFKDLNNLNGPISLPTFHAARTIMGSFGLVLIVITAVAAILTGIIGAYRAILHLLSTMAEEHILAKVFSKRSYSIFFIMALSVLISLLGRNTLNWFVDLTSFGAIVAYGYLSAAAYKIAKLESNRRIMLVGIAGTIISILFGIAQIVPGLSVLDTMSAEAFLFLCLWCLVGFGFYWHTVKQSPLSEYHGLSISGVVLFALLIYTALMWFGKLLARKQSIGDVHILLQDGGIVLILIIFLGFFIMVFIQKLVRQMHEKLEREKIRAVEGNIARSQFLFNMSHDIRTPMNAIMGYTTLALREPASMHKDYLKKIEKSSKQLLTLLNDILEMSRIENGKIQLEYKPMDLCLLFEEMGELFAAQMVQKRIHFTLNTSQLRNHYVWCDKTNLNRVLLNIISNAYKFTPDGGSIAVSAYENESGESGYGSYEFRFKDSGIGMSKEFAAKMFDAFERERSSTASGVEGTGLGLAITKSIVNLMGGTIEVFTEQGSGTEFVIHIKLRLAEEKDLKKDSTSGGDPLAKVVDFTGKRLLLVEDNAINLEIAQMLLEQMGFQVETAENGKVAVEKVSASQPGHYDAILMDIQMPVMDGYAAAREIRALKDPKLAGIPILAMTANAFPEDIQAAKEAGMQSHIAKPIDVAVLKKELELVLKS